MLCARGVKKSFGSRTVLDGVDIALAPGSITCLIGPSGGGKTTLLRALALVDPPDAGQIVVDTQHYMFPMARGAAFPPPWPGVTAVFQTLFLWPHMTLRENIVLPARNIPGIDIEAELSDLIDFFDMADFVDRHPNEASLGQRQRAALARALILKPRTLLLDEITSALDVEQSARILALLQKLKGLSTGLLVITHALGFARRAADRIVFLDGGRIVEQGPPQILDKPQSARLAAFVSLIEQAH